ncbi:MAG: putative quinol monooxygenase [Candidatus Acidiferrales bacterium]
MSEKLTVVARIRAKPGKEEEVKQALLGLVGPTRGEAGCLNYDLHQSHDDAALFLFYEDWTSRAALDAHAQSAHIQAFRARGRELLAEPTEIKLFRMVSNQAT